MPDDCYGCRSKLGSSIERGINLARSSLGHVLRAVNKRLPRLSLSVWWPGAGSLREPCREAEAQAGDDRGRSGRRRIPRQEGGQQAHQARGEVAACSCVCASENRVFGGRNLCSLPDQHTNSLISQRCRVVRKDGRGTGSVDMRRGAESAPRLTREQTDIV